VRASQQDRITGEVIEGKEDVLKRQVSLFLHLTKQVVHADGSGGM